MATVYPRRRVGASFVNGNHPPSAARTQRARALLGKVVRFAGESHGEYRAVPAFLCMALPEGTPATKGASCFVNPLTALGMVETMRAEGHTGLVHTAAASNLGQMLNRICLADGVPLVNIVRRDEQAAILRELGAEHIVDSSSLTVTEDLTAALVTTAFDHLELHRVPTCFAL